VEKEFKWDERGKWEGEEKDRRMNARRKRRRVNRTGGEGRGGME
jgi:hypothetical protein